MYLVVIGPTKMSCVCLENHNYILFKWHICNYTNKFSNIPNGMFIVPCVCEMSIQRRKKKFIVIYRVVVCFIIINCNVIPHTHIHVHKHVTHVYFQWNNKLLLLFILVSFTLDSFCLVILYTFENELMIDEWWM